jgi:hypothetical protein
MTEDPIATRSPILSDSVWYALKLRSRSNGLAKFSFFEYRYPCMSAERTPELRGYVLPPNRKGKEHPDRPYVTANYLNEKA